MLATADFFPVCTLCFRNKVESLLSIGLQFTALHLLHLILQQLWLQIMALRLREHHLVANRLEQAETELSLLLPGPTRARIPIPAPYCLSWLLRHRKKSAFTPPLSPPSWKSISKDRVLLQGHRVPSLPEEAVPAFSGTVLKRSPF